MSSNRSSPAAFAGALRARENQAPANQAGALRRAILVSGLISLALAGQVAAPVTITSPDRRIAIVIEGGERGQPLAWRATMAGKPVIESSPLGIRVDGTALNDGVEVRNVERYEVDETYAWRGVHARAVNRASGARITIEHLATRTSYVVDARLERLGRVPDHRPGNRTTRAGCWRWLPPSARQRRVVTRPGRPL
jgi:hypothetical protein